MFISLLCPLNNNYNKNNKNHENNNNNHNKIVKTIMTMNIKLICFLDVDINIFMNSRTQNIPGLATFYSWIS